MVKLIVLLFVLFGLSCGSAASDQSANSNESLFDQVFGLSKVIRLKYRPVYSLGSRPTTKLDIQKNWIYSASIDCASNCGRSAKRLKDFLNSSKLTDEDCPLPIFAVVEFVGTNEGDLETISVNASGRCFIFNGQAYISPRLFTMFTETNNISIFESVMDE